VRPYLKNNFKKAGELPSKSKALSSNPIAPKTFFKFLTVYAKKWGKPLMPPSSLAENVLVAQGAPGTQRLRKEGTTFYHSGNT
jgi:hypothetical protein